MVRLTPITRAMGIFAFIQCLILTGCAGSDFKGDNAPKPVANKTPNSGDGQPFLQNNDPFGDLGNPGATGDEYQAGSSFIPVIKVCSDRQSQSNGTNVVTAQGVVVKLVDTQGMHHQVQADPMQTKDAIRFQNSVSVVLPKVPDGEYLAIFCDAAYANGCGAGAMASATPVQQTTSFRKGSAATSQTTGAKYGSLGSGAVTIQGGTAIVNQPIRLTYFINPQNAQMMNAFQGMFSNMMSSAGAGANPMAQMMGAMMPQSYTPTGQQMTIAAECQDNSSPLMIDLADRGLKFTSQANGISFDIDGDGSKDQISWLSHDQIGILSIDINKNGKIDSIHELFGNNTKGPDEKLAANGFDALGKYDSNGDGIISSEDSIFDLLTLWTDENFDGESQSEELHSLSDLQIESISLNYSFNIKEDRYGNQSRESSLVRMTDGREKTMVDVWFLPALKNRS